MKIQMPQSLGLTQICLQLYSTMCGQIRNTQSYSLLLASEIRRAHSLYPFSTANPYAV